MAEEVCGEVAKKKERVAPWEDCYKYYTRATAIELSGKRHIIGEVSMADG